MCDKTFKSKGALLNHRKEEHENIRYDCEICDKKFKRRWYLKKHVQNMHVNPKPKSMSRGEEKVKKWLEENEVEFQREVTFEDLKGISGGHLRFDFVVDLGVSSGDKKIMIEVDGDQHYKIVQFHKSQDPIKNFCNIIIHDSLKKLYCELKNYKLIRLRYKDLDNLSNLLNEVIY